MNLSSFFDSFDVTADSGNAPLVLQSPRVDADFIAVIDVLGGKTFNNGLYRVFKGNQVHSVKKDMERFFPEFVKRIVPFGYDWLGRHFAIDLARKEGGKPQVLILEVGAGEAMEIPATICNFHNMELVQSADDALALPFYRKWRHEYSTALSPNECVGYKVPLFLGGKDDISNLEVIDMSVYVEICGQLRNKTRILEPGQTVGSVSIL